MKVCVFGAGALGSYLAVRLSLAGADTSVIARGAQLDAIRTRGIRLREKGEDFVAHPRASSRAETVGPQDIVIVAVKTPSLPALAAPLRPLIGDDTQVVFVLNGLPWWYLNQIEPNPAAWSPPLRRIAEAMLGVVRPERVIGCVAFSANQVVEPGVVQNAERSTNEFVLAPLAAAGVPACDRLAAAIRAGGALSRREAVLAPVIWRKLAFNVVSGIIGSLTGATSRRLFNEEALKPLVGAVVEEVAALAKACGVDDAAPDLDRLARDTPERKSSMLQDFEQGRTAEIDTLLGALCDLGRLKRIEVTRLDTLHALARARATTLGIYP